jgi:DNA-binding GntR family transcriptional regulator
VKNQRRSAAQPKPARRLADGVYATMLNQLITQDIKPGERITVDGVSRALGVSQTPVREALTRLESDDLVSKVHLVGYRATAQLERPQLEALYELRLLLETEAAAKAAGLHTPEQAEAMRAAIVAMNGLADPRNQRTYAEFALEDAALHDIVWQSAGNEFLRDALTRLHSHVHIFRLRADTRVSPDALGEHEELAEAIVAKDARRARKAMKEHLTASRERLRRSLDDEAAS